MSDNATAASGCLRELWRSESYNYFQRNYGDVDLRQLAPNADLHRVVNAAEVDRIPGGSVLEIGCGPAANLHYLVQHTQASCGVGVEASAQTVAALGKAFPEYEFVVGDGISLPFATGGFDWVLMRSFLHWVDRTWLLHTLGEALRVCQRYLIVSDFAPPQPYSTPYHHQPGYRTFKMRYRSLLEATGLLQTVASVTRHVGDPWRACETTLYRKLPVEQAFPLRLPSEFVCNASGAPA